MFMNTEKFISSKISVLTTFIFITHILIFICTINAYSADKPNKYAAGVKTTVSSGMTDSYIYYQPFLSAKIYLDRFTFSPIAARIQDYQLTDGNGNYEYVNINKAGTSLSYEINDTFEVSGGYYYNSGDASYILHDIYGELYYDTDDYGISGAYTIRNSGYNVNTMDISESLKIINIDYSYYPDDKSSLDLSYEYKSTDISNSSSLFTVSTIRGGYSTLVSDSGSFLAGLNIGRDSADYTILGVDAGISVKMFENLKLSVFYLGSYSAPDLLVTKKSGTKGGGGSPFMDPSKSGDAVISHTVSAGAEIYF